MGVLLGREWRGGRGVLAVTFACERDAESGVGERRRALEGGGGGGGRLGWDGMGWLGWGGGGSGEYNELKRSPDPSLSKV